MHSAPSSWDGWTLTAVLAVGLPLLGYVLYRRLALAPDPTPTRAKLGIYGLTVATQWILVLILFAVAARHSITSADLGLRWGKPSTTIGAACLALLALTAVTWTNLREIRRSGLEDLRSAVERARRFVPVGSKETYAYIVVALTAGFCEELLYRGWLVSFLGALMGSVWYGVLVGGAVFGLAHGYQGMKGMLATGILGILFGALYASVRSLFPGMLFHAGLDVVNGVLAGRIVRNVARAEARDATQARDAGEARDAPGEASV